MKFGRPPKLTLHQRREAWQLLEAGHTQADVGRFNVNPTTIGRDRPAQGSALMTIIRTSSWWTSLPPDHIRIGVCRRVPKGFERCLTVAPAPQA